jgi:hypothetical protein
LEPDKLESRKESTDLRFSLARGIDFGFDPHDLSYSLPPLPPLGPPISPATPPRPAPQLGKFFFHLTYPQSAEQKNIKPPISHGLSVIPSALSQVRKRDTDTILYNYLYIIFMYRPRRPRSKRASPTPPGARTPFFGLHGHGHGAKTPKTPAGGGGGAVPLSPATMPPAEFMAMVNERRKVQAPEDSEDEELGRGMAFNNADHVVLDLDFEAVTAGKGGKKGGRGIGGKEGAHPKGHVRFVGEEDDAEAAAAAAAERLVRGEGEDSAGAARGKGPKGPKRGDKGPRSNGAGGLFVSSFFLGFRG